MTAGTADVGSQRRVRVRPGRILLYAFISLTALLWLVPIAGAIFASLRPFAETVRDGFFSWPHTLTLDNYRNAWSQGDIPHKYLNTALILIPALIFTLFFASMVAFVCSRYSWRFNILLLSIFTAGNLLPQQIDATRVHARSPFTLCTEPLTCDCLAAFWPARTTPSRAWSTSHPNAAPRSLLGPAGR